MTKTLPTYEVALDQLRTLAGLERGNVTMSIGKTFYTVPDLFYVIETHVGTSNRWRDKVLDRDRDTCRMCGSCEMLHAHHILPKALFPEAAAVVNNGITLCARCHIIIVHGSNTFDLTQWKRFVKFFESLVEDVKL